MKTLITTTCLFILGFTLAACGGASAATVEPVDTPAPADTAVPPTDAPPPTDTPEPEVVVEPGDPHRGQVIFEEGGANENYKPSNYCSSCHSLDGSEDNGPTLQGVARIAAERVPGLTAEEYIRQSIMEPGEYVVEDFKQMGRISSALLSEQEVEDVVAFLLTQDELPAPTAVPPTATPEPQAAIEPGDPARGQDIFETGGEVISTKCINCHTLDGSQADANNAGPTMLGIAAVAAERVPGMTADQYLLQSILDPGAYVVDGYEDKMEKSYQWLLSDEDLAGLLAFLLTLE